ncbi:MAG: FIST C-terminal domain-containing protein [Thermoguttaceae bacterium]|jgi:hypothetical protein|nr:FIST C-terminal domain-containing protein [Thermoguttaceae bacterium]
MRSFKWHVLFGGLTWGLAAGLALAADDAWSSAPPAAGGKIVFRVATAEDENPQAAGKAAAESLQKAMAGAPLRAVIVSECFEDRENKQKLLKAIASVLPEQIIVGGATYGSITQAGCTDADSVCLLGIGGDGVGVSAALVTAMGTAKLTFETDRAKIEQCLHDAGAKLAGKLRRTDQDRLLVLIADAHAPKNQALVEGVQKVVGAQFPIAGGCVNKNAGQTFVYFGGALHDDSAVALMLSGDFRVGLAGRQAKENDKVISTARQSAAEALAAVQGKPLAALAFDCAGRRSKLKKIEEELAAMQRAIGKDLPLFGCYCAGEMGPVDLPEQKPNARCGGAGWHVMFTILAAP